MAKLKRNVAGYTVFGLLLDALCREKGYSLHRLARESGTGSHSSLVRACQGKSQPSRDLVLSWCNALQCTAEQRAALMHAIGYATPEEMVREEKTE